MFCVCVCVAGDENVHLSKILSFFTGAESVPALGFDVQPVLTFSPSAIYPTASTCALQLTLPTMHYNKPDTFKEKMLYALKNHGGFGLI